MNATVSNAATHAAQVAQANIDARNNLIANSIYTRKRQANVTNIDPNSNPSLTYSIPLQSIGLITSVDLDITLNFTAGATAATPNVGAPYNSIQNVGFVDQSSIQRSSLSGRMLYDLMSMLTGGINGVSPWNAAIALSQGGGEIPTISFPAIPNIAANGNGTVKFRLHLPIARSSYDLTGGVILQTGQNNTPAVVNLNLATVFGGTAETLYDNAVTLTSGTISVRQNYWTMMNPGIALPALDLASINYMWETAADSSNLVAGQQKEVQLQIQYTTDLVEVRYFNGTTYEQGGDISYFEDWLGNFLVNDSSPNQRYQDYRLNHGYDAAPGLYWGDFRNNPIKNANLGLYLWKITPSSVNANAKINTFYRQIRPVQAMGGAQPSVA